MNAIASFLDGTHESLDRAFGLIAPAVRPKRSEGDRFELSCDAFEIKYRAEGGLEQSWFDIASELDAQEKYGCNHRDLRKMVEVTHRDRIEAHFRRIDAKIISRQLEQHASERLKAKIKSGRGKK
jgi:hypothetical protein